MSEYYIYLSKTINLLIHNFIIISQKFKFWKLYVYRYLTNTPTVAFCVIFIIAFSAYVKSGAMLLSEIMANNCKTYWWSTLLHIQNYVNPHDMVSNQI